MRQKVDRRRFLGGYIASRPLRLTEDRRSKKPVGFGHATVRSSEYPRQGLNIATIPRKKRGKAGEATSNPTSVVKSHQKPPVATVYQRSSDSHVGWPRCPQRQSQRCSNCLMTEQSSSRNRRQALRPQEAADSLGISLSTLERLTRSGRIPRIKIGRVVLYRVAALEEWLASTES